MKKICLGLCILIAGCKSGLSLATNPDKGDFNSGTIGSVKATDNIANPDIVLFHPRDSQKLKTDSLHRWNADKISNATISYEIHFKWK